MMPSIMGVKTSKEVLLCCCCVLLVLLLCCCCGGCGGCGLFVCWLVGWLFLIVSSRVFSFLMTDDVDDAR